MAWFVLLFSGAFEAVWATALGRSDGLTRPMPTTVFVISLLVSMGGLAYAMREIPTGTAYAVWVAVGASLTVVYAMWTGEEPYSLIKAALLVGLVGCVIGLKMVSSSH